MRTYNDYIRYYLETEIDFRMPGVVDKKLFKEYASAKGISTPRILDSIKDTCVIKAKNDSGGVAIVKNGEVDANKFQRLYKYKDKPYGVDKGEWFYKTIPWELFYEEYLGDNLTDYKFHCHNGKVMFCQLIFDRQTGKTKECIVLPNRTFLDYRLDENFEFSIETALPSNWDDLLEAARILSEDWKYVRVDLYSVEDKVYAGELTFAPRAGRYTGEGQEKLGEYF